MYTGRAAQLPEIKYITQRSKGGCPTSRGDWCFLPPLLITTNRIGFHLPAMNILPDVFITFEDSTQASLPSVNSYIVEAKLFGLKKERERENTFPILLACLFGREGINDSDTNNS